MPLPRSRRPVFASPRHFVPRVTSKPWPLYCTHTGLDASAAMRITRRLAGAGKRLLNVGGTTKNLRRSTQTLSMVAVEKATPVFPCLAASPSSLPPSLAQSTPHKSILSLFHLPSLFHAQGLGCRGNGRHLWPLAETPP